MFTSLKENWKFYVTVSTPVALSIIPLLWQTGTGKEPYCAFVICLMAIYWMTECIPIPITSFIPIVLFPLFGILSTDRVTSVYLTDSLLFLLGGCIIALAFEYSNLHSRIALKVIMLVGAKISQLLLGIMVTTMFLSMWMNNTSTTAMMVPIVHALIEELQIKMLDHCNIEVESGMSQDGTQLVPLRANESQLALKEFEVLPQPQNKLHEKQKEVKEKIQRLRNMFLLGTAYASNIGGTGVITGSATNLIALDLVRKDAEEPYTSESCRSMLDISFLNWMIFNVPPMVLNTLLCYFYLQIHFIGIAPSWKFWQKKNISNNVYIKRNAKTLEKSIKQTISQKYEHLGPFDLHEIGVTVFFVVMVILWVFKDPQFMPGWDSFFEKTPQGKSFIREATPTLLIAVLMFAVPSKGKYYKNFMKGSLGVGMKDPLLNWTFVKEKFPWGIFILLGGGASMALGAKESGLNKWLGKFLASSETLKSLPNFALLFIILLMIAVLTTVASNTAVAAIITPVLLGMSYIKDIHPLYLVLPATTVCSYAFVLPVSTPPNAIVYSASPDLKLRDMIIPGLVVNIVSVMVLLVTTQTTSTWLLGFNDYNGECQNMTLLATQTKI